MNVNDYIRETDSRSIQAAIDAAEKAGDPEVRIPAINKRTGEHVYNIDEVILLPSNITIILESARLRMADGAITQIFRNKNAYEEIGTTEEGTQENIHIIGTGTATLDGGIFNELNEATSSKNGLPSVYENLMICFFNVKNFSIRGIKILNQRWWSMAMIYCEYGMITDLEYSITNRDDKLWHNQDGIDIRGGCNNIIIENIRGETGDDLIALTNLLRDGTGISSQMRVKSRKTDIHDISIRNVYGYTTLCAIIRVLAHYGNKIYNINIENIHDTSEVGKHSRSQMIIRIGDEIQHDFKVGTIPENRTKHGEICNIRIKGVYSRALIAVQTATTIKNIHVSDIFVHTDGQYAYYCGYGDLTHREKGIFIPEHEEKQKYCRYKDLDRMEKVDFEEYKCIAENVVVENIYHTAKSLCDEENGAVVVFNHSDLRNVEIKNVCVDSNLEKIRYRKCIGKIN